jgi:hypothetical protein
MIFYLSPLPHLKIDKKSMKSWPVNMQIQYIPIRRRNFFIYVSKRTNMEILILFTKIVVQVGLKLLKNFSGHHLPIKNKDTTYQYSATNKSFCMHYYPTST